MMIERPMTFIQSKNAIKSATYTSSKKLRLLTSGTITQLKHFLLGASAKIGIKIDLETFEFGTFHQTLATKKGDDKDEIAILLPWDFIKCLDWRLGGTDNLILDPLTVLVDAERFSDRIKQRGFKKIIYLNTPVLGAFGSTETHNAVLLRLELLALDLGATVVGPDHFNLQSYLNSGLTIKSSSLGYIAQIITAGLVPNNHNKKKVIVTDLDLTLWDGVLGEDGLSAISSEPNGNSFYHFIYQRQLKRFKNAGILLCIVSKNDFDLVKEALQSNKFEISYGDFVSVRSSYEVKSKHIVALSESLNLGLDSFVFIDDNPVEIAQVSSVLPNITCLQFSSDPELFNIFLNNLSSLFTFTSLTEEDSSRTHLYKKMLSTKQNIDASTNHDENNINLDNFLKSLEMKLRLKNCTYSDCQRPSQLINKTNQFNMNGVRRKEDEIMAIIRNGGQLLSAELIDNTGSHGEIIAILIDHFGNVLSFVMSCRVFQRKVELAFLYAIVNYLNIDLNIKWSKTMRNEPFAKFVHTMFPGETSQKFTIKKSELQNVYSPESGLFEFLV